MGELPRRPVQGDSPLKFTFLENDQQALAKVASGVDYDLIHPCIAYWPDYKAAGLIQAFDPSLLPDLRRHPRGDPASPAVDTDGLIYHVPFDIGFSTLIYRADKVSPAELSWNVSSTPQYKGRMALFSDEVSIIKIGHLINAGKPVDPNVLDHGGDPGRGRDHEEGRTEPAELLGLADRHGERLRQRQHRHDVHLAGRVLEDQEPREDEGRPDRVHAAEGGPPGLGLRARARRQHEGARACDLAVAAANTPKIAAWLTDVYQYGAAQQNGVAALVENKEIVTAFQLDDPTAFAPPEKAWFEAPLPNRAEYVKAGRGGQGVRRRST